MASYSEIAKKKILGIPAIYLAAVFVAVFAYVAWRMKPTAAPEVTQDEVTSNADVQPAENDPAYSGLNTQGTVVVAPQQPVADTIKEETNESWARGAITWLINEKNVNPGVAQAAISKYIDGENLTFDEGKIRDDAVRKFGPPPDGLGRIGITSSEPARKQSSVFPVRHTVRGPNDNTILKLSSLYYGTSDWLHYTEIMAVNEALGRSQTTELPVGTVVTIPKYTPDRYFYATRDTLSPARVASKNGITEYALSIMNPNMYKTPIKVGQKFRVS